MNILQMAGFAAAAALCVLILRRMRPEMAAGAALAAGSLLLLAVVTPLGQVVDGLLSLAAEGGVASSYLTQLLKVCGVALLMDMAAQTCRDVGEDGLALKTELAGRVMILALTLPAMRALLTQILSLAA